MPPKKKQQQQQQKRQRIPDENQIWERGAQISNGQLSRIVDGWGVFKRVRELLLTDAEKQLLKAQPFIRQNVVDYVQSEYVRDQLEIRQSNILPEGMMGLFAVQGYPAERVIVPYLGKIWIKYQYADLKKEKNHRAKKTKDFQISRHLLIDGSQMGRRNPLAKNEAAMANTNFISDELNADLRVINLQNNEPLDWFNMSDAEYDVYLRQMANYANPHLWTEQSFTVFPCLYSTKAIHGNSEIFVDYGENYFGKVLNEDKNKFYLKGKFIGTQMRQGELEQNIQDLEENYKVKFTDKQKQWQRRKLRQKQAEKELFDSLKDKVTADQVRANNLEPFQMEYNDQFRPRGNRRFNFLVARVLKRLITSLYNKGSIDKYQRQRAYVLLNKKLTSQEQQDLQNLQVQLLKRRKRGPGGGEEQAIEQEKGGEKPMPFQQRLEELRRRKRQKQGEEEQEEEEEIEGTAQEQQIKKLQRRLRQEESQLKGGGTKETKDALKKLLGEPIEYRKTEQGQKTLQKMKEILKKKKIQKPASELEPWEDQKERILAPEGEAYSRALEKRNQ